MKEDLSKILSQTIYTYVFLLLIVFILKLAGLNYFGLEMNNPVIIAIDSFANKYQVTYIWYCITLYIYIYTIISISCNDNSIKMKKYCILITIFSMISLLTIKPYIAEVLVILYDTVMLLIATIIYTKKLNFKIISKLFVLIILNLAYQIVSLIIRDQSIIIEKENFVKSLIFNFDYILLIIITYKVYFREKGEARICGDHFSFLHLQTSLKSLPVKLQRKLQNNKEKTKKLTKEEKITNAIYIPLVIIWNIFTVAVVLFVAFLNDTVIECIFILNAFWMSKTVFGKAFHMKNAMQCFIVSNLTYYCLNRITTPIGISLLVPIILGILLSYFTSKLVKKQEPPEILHRGMSEEEFYRIISKVTRNELDIKICKLYYCDREKEEKIAQIVNYSKESIQKHKKNIVNKLKEIK